MGPSGFPVIIESQAIMVSTRLAIGKLIHALEVWSDDPRLPNIDLYSTNPLQPTLQQYSANLGNTSSTHCAHGVWCCIAIQRNTALYILQLYSALHSTALYNPPQAQPGSAGEQWSRAPSSSSPGAL